MVENSYIPKEFLNAIFEYPFGQLGVNQIIAHVEVANTASCKMLEKMGFEQVAVVPGVFKSGDCVIYRMLRQACRYLEK